MNSKVLRHLYSILLVLSIATSNIAFSEPMIKSFSSDNGCSPQEIEVLKVQEREPTFSHSDKLNDVSMIDSDPKKSILNKINNSDCLILQNDAE